MPLKKKKTSHKTTSLVGIIMGSASDSDTMRPTKEILQEMGIACEFKVVSAHRTPDEMFAYAETARARGIEVIIAGAGGSAHLPGMIAAKTTLPVIGVPVKTKSLHGMDSLLSIVQMPKGIPVATVAIGGGANAGLLAARILSIKHPGLVAKLEKYTARLRRLVVKMKV